MSPCGDFSKVYYGCLALVGRALEKGNFLFLMSPSQRKKIRTLVWKAVARYQGKTGRI